MSLSPTSYIGCLAYGYELTPYACIQNQLGLVLPVHPCWGCRRPVTIELTAPISEGCDQGLSIGLGLGQVVTPGNVTSQRTPRCPCPPDMTPAVARRLGLI